MSERIVKADTKAIDQLGADLVTAKKQLLGRLAERGYQLLRKEVPKETRNLEQGVAPPAVDYDAGRAELVVSARSGATGGGAGQVFNKDGKVVKTVTLNPQPGYNYADVVARGNNPEHGPTLSPSKAKAFLIPVSVKPTDEGYLMVGGKYFVFRRSRKAQKPNPFDERAAAELEKEIPAISDGVLSQFV